MRSIGFAARVLALMLASGAVHAAEVFKFATVAPDGTAWMREMRAGAEAVKQRSEGRVEIKFYPGGVMGDPATVLRKIKIGQLHGGAFTGSELSPISSDAQIYSTPFLFNDQAEVDALRPKFDDRVKATLEPKGFVALGFTGGGFAYLMSTKDIKTREDLKASKVWVPQGDEISEIAFKTAGVSPIPLPLADVYTSLQTGLIDTAANTTAGAIAFQWHTKIKHIVDLPASYVVGLLIIDKRALDKLGAPDQVIVRDEIGKVFARLDTISREDNAKALETLKAQGIAVYTPTAQERANWQSIGTEAAATLKKEGKVSADLLTAITDALATIRAGK